MEASQPFSCMSDSQFEAYAAEQLKKARDILGIRKQSSGDFDYERESYSVTNDPRGLALILANEEFKENFDNRIGTNKDVEELANLYKEQKLEVIQFKNLTGEQMKKAAEQTASICDEHEVDIFVCVILSHGSDEDDDKKECETIAGSDGKLFATSKIIIEFKECPGLEGKPKLVFIQACRGKREDVGVPSRSEVDHTGQSGQPASHSDAVLDASPVDELHTEDDPHKQIAGLSLKGKGPFKHQAQSTPPERSSAPPSDPPSAPPENLSTPPSVHLLHFQPDFLVMYATPPGYCAYRYTSGGSPFIKILCAALKDYDFKLTDDSESGTVSLLWILTSVSYEVTKVPIDYEGSKYKEMPMIVPSLTKDVLMLKKPQATNT